MGASFFQSSTSVAPHPRMHRAIAQENAICRETIVKNKNLGPRIS